jgi:hypothetical protein
MPLTVQQLAQANQACTLNLYNQDIEDADIPLLCEYLRQHSETTTLILTRNRIGPGGASVLAANISVPSLVIATNHIGDEGAIALAANGNLIALWVGDNGITNRGAMALAASQSLTELSANLNKIGDMGAMTLANNKHFTKLQLFGNHITPNGAAVCAALGHDVGNQKVPPISVSQTQGLFAGKEVKEVVDETLVANGQGYRN